MLTLDNGCICYSVYLYNMSIVHQVVAPYGVSPLARLALVFVVNQVEPYDVSPHVTHDDRGNYNYGLVSTALVYTVSPVYELHITYARLCPLFDMALVYLECRHFFNDWFKILIYKTMVRLTLLNSCETWPIPTRDEKQMWLTEKWMVPLAMVVCVLEHRKN